MKKRVVKAPDGEWKIVKSDDPNQQLEFYAGMPAEQVMGLFIALMKQSDNEADKSAVRNIMENGDMMIQANRWVDEYEAIGMRETYGKTIRNIKQKK